MNREIKRLMNERYKKNRDFKPRRVVSNSGISRTAETNVHVRNQAWLQKID